MIVRNYNCDGELIEDLSKVKVSEDVKMIWQTALMQSAKKKKKQDSGEGENHEKRPKAV